MITQTELDVAFHFWFRLQVLPKRRHIPHHNVRIVVADRDDGPIRAHDVIGVTLVTAPLKGNVVDEPALFNRSDVGCGGGCQCHLHL